MQIDKNIHSDWILILDFGSQYTQLIARRVREAGVYCEIWAFDHCDEALEGRSPKGVILSGGPETVTVDDSPRAPGSIFEMGVPVLGICYGMQTMAAQLGGTVTGSAKHEYGYARVKVTNPSRLLEDIEDHAGQDGVALLDVWMSHGDHVTQLPPGFTRICESDNAPVAGMADETRRFYGLQFHPEVTHTRQGQRILQRFDEDQIRHWVEVMPHPLGVRQALLEMLVQEDRRLLADPGLVRQIARQLDEDG